MDTGLAIAAGVLGIAAVVCIALLLTLGNNAN